LMSVKIRCGLAPRSEKKPFKLVIVALANKMARIAWSLLTRQRLDARLSVRAG
jgi:hypothetical protein